MSLASVAAPGMGLAGGFGNVDDFTDTNVEAQQRAERENMYTMANAFSAFLRDDPDYREQLERMVQNLHQRLIINITDLKRIEGMQEPIPLSNKVLLEPTAYVQPLELAVSSLIKGTPLEAHLAKLQTFPRVGFSGAFGRHDVNPRSLTANLVSKLVRVTGIVTHCSLPRPKMVISAYSKRPKDQWPASFVPHAGSMVVRSHRDYAALSKQLRLGDAPVPTTDLEGNVYEPEYGLSVYKDYQKLLIQEMPEHAPTGQLPRSVEVVCEEDLCDKVKPGDRVRVTGVFRPMGKREANGVTSSVFKVLLIMTNVELVNEKVQKAAPSMADVANINEIARRPDIFELIARSFAPSICGRESIKKGMVLLLLGGNEQNLANGTHLRGDIHMLMIGDPSCGKSQLLRFLMGLAPLAMSTTGRGASGVGLTAAVTTDQDTGEKRLEAGAMVLADRGIVCIDEFDKMSTLDRVAIHEVMEQQTVTIAKAGIHATLNSRCSVVAAANPIYGQIVDGRDLFRQIAFPDSLLSRFDLVYIVRDMKDETEDRRIARHVIQQGRSKGQDGDARGRRRAGGFQGGLYNQIENKDASHTDEAKVFEDISKVQHQALSDGTVPEILTVDFLRKYIRFAKETKTPKLSNEASQAIADNYTDLRAEYNKTWKSKKRRVAITTRTLEALIRLSTAHAKLRLSDVVEKKDVTIAVNLIQHTLSATELMDASGIPDEEDEIDDEMVEEDEEEEEEVQAKQSIAKKGKARKTTPVRGARGKSRSKVMEQSSDDDDDDDDDDDEMDGDENRAAVANNQVKADKRRQRPSVGSTVQRGKKQKRRSRQQEGEDDVEMGGTDASDAPIIFEDVDPRYDELRKAFRTAWKGTGEMAGVLIDDLRQKVNERLNPKASLDEFQEFLDKLESSGAGGILQERANGMVHFLN